jgi:hypothetical protein
MKRNLVSTSVETAYAFLEKCHHSDREVMSSNALASTIARWARVNGMSHQITADDVVVAAGSLGFEVTRRKPSSEVCAIYIRPADVRKLRDIAIEREYASIGV